MPNDPDETLSTGVALITYLTTNIREILEQNQIVVRSNVENLVGVLEMLCGHVDEAFPGPVATRDRLKAMEAGILRKNDLDEQLGTLEGVALANNTLTNLFSQSTYEALPAETSSMYEEIMEDIYEEIQQDIYDEVPLQEEPSSFANAELPQKKKNRKNKNESKYADMKAANLQLKERSITLCTVVQQANTTLSQETKEEISMVTVGLQKAKESLKKVVTFIKDEIERVKQIITQKKQERQKRRKEKARQKAAERRQKTPLPELPSLVEDDAYPSEDEEIPTYDDEEDENDPLYEELQRVELKLKKLEEREEEVGNLYITLGVADNMLDGVVKITGRFYIHSRDYMYMHQSYHNQIIC